MNRFCPGCRESGSSVVRYGSYFRRSDSRHIQRFHCKSCGQHFSSATFSPCYRQKKRRLNHRVYFLLGSGMSLRRLAIALGCSRTTVARKLMFVAAQARARQHSLLAHFVAHNGPITAVQLDDLETFEHTKCKPLTVTVAVNADNRMILDVAVAPIAAKGHLAAISRKKYGKRRDRSQAARHQLFERLTPWISPEAVFCTDEHQGYPVLLRKHFPDATHKRYKSIRGCVTGQGELKKTGFDPLFCVNHTLAMLRANINRLVRRTWCTTKRPARLADHLALYTDFHNQLLLVKGRTT